MNLHTEISECTKGAARCVERAKTCRIVNTTFGWVAFILVMLNVAFQIHASSWGYLINTAAALLMLSLMRKSFKDAEEIPHWWMEHRQAWLEIRDRFRGLK